MLRLLEPLVRFVGHLDFRNKLRITAGVFGLPLLIAAGLLYSILDARVVALDKERAALAVQSPIHNTLAKLYLLAASRQGVQEGAEQLAPQVLVLQAEARKSVANLQAAFTEHPVLSTAIPVNGEHWLGRWDEISKLIDNGSPEQLVELLASLRIELDKLNEATGLLIDGDASSSRLLDVITKQLPRLIDTTGQTANLGTITLTKKSLRGSRRDQLTLLRGNFNSLVLWSMEGLEKVGKENVELASGLDEISSQLNQAYLSIQETMTIKMLDTTDYGMEPEVFLAMTGKALDETLQVSTKLAKSSDLLLAARLNQLETQRDTVVLAMLLIFALVVTGFIAAYISIMRCLHGLSEAVHNMSSGNLTARVNVTTKDELGDVGTQFNLMVQNLAERTSQLREKTHDIHAMLQNMPQGIFTIVAGGTVHHEYSAFLEQILETPEIAGKSAMQLIFERGNINADVQSQIEASIAACIGEDRMNFDFNSHLLVDEVIKTMPDGRQKYLDLTWSPICDESDMVEKIIVSVRDETELRKLATEAEHQKHELALIGQILTVSQEKFHEFIDSTKDLLAENEALLQCATGNDQELVAKLFRNMHTIKGNARTYGLLHLTNIVHEAEQSYDELRKNPTLTLNSQALLLQLQQVAGSVEEYAAINETKLGRKGPGRRGSAEKYFMVPRERVEQWLTELNAYNLQAVSHETLAALLKQVRQDLRLIGTESIHSTLEGVFDSLPSLAKELGKEPPKLIVHEHGIHLRNQVSDLLRNVFMHLYRNAMDHGIENAAVRTAAGKPAAGNIALDLELTEQQLRLHLQDDGKGLALAHIRRKAIENGVISADTDVADEFVAKLIFAAGFSTATAVTEVSGRGVGMDAVMAFIKREGGEIEIRFTDNATGADFRQFETVLSLPAKYAVSAHETETPAHLPISHSKPSPAVVTGAHWGEAALVQPV